VVVLLLTGGFTTLAIGKEAAINQQTTNLTFQTPSTTITTIDSITCTELTVPGVTDSLISPGAPAVPMTVTVMELPFGSTVLNVNVVPTTTQTMTLLYPAMPSPQAVIQDDAQAPAHFYIDPQIYTSNIYYPTAWFDYSTGGGRNSQGDHVTFLSIRTFPVRVSPASGTIQYMQGASVTVQYKAPTTPKTFGTGYDLVIIAPAAFASSLQPLVTEKISHGINTTVKTLEDIYTQYQGYDKPEQIKYFIKDALDTWNTKYVLLVGGMKGYLIGKGAKDDTNSGVKNWYFPVRYNNVDEGGTEHDPGFITDLYFADIYDSHGNFSSWDSNGDHIYGKWLQGHMGKDIVDLYPDVAIGRLAVRNTNELTIEVNKIIAYESKPLDASWFKKAIIVGGDSFDDTSMGNIYEGEVSTNYSYMENLAPMGISPVRVFASLRNISNDFTPTPQNLERVITEGAGFLYFDGHGSPVRWDTHWHDLFTWKNGQTPGGLKEYQMRTFKNGEKLNVCIVGGCHNSMLNVSFFWTINPNNHATWCYGAPAPRSWSEWMMAAKNGGSIACMGNTGLGYGLIGNVGGEPACYQGLGGYIERTFLQEYKNNPTKTLGNCWTGAMNRYLQKWPGMVQQADAKTVEEWLALGDPSLLIGGY